jgi:PAP2 superfamily
MHIIDLILNSQIFSLLLLFGAIIWMLQDEKDKTRPLLVLALVVNLFYGVLLAYAMGREGSLFPWKFDYILFLADGSLGIHAATIARPLQGFWHVPLWAAYQLMIPMMIAWFLVTRRRNPRTSVVLAYVAELVTGPLLYAILPACGPIYAFGKQWLHPPAVQPYAIRLAGLPNAFPSLHVGTAFLFLLSAPGKRWKIFAFIYLVATCLATLSTGEHYVIDLVPGFAFGAFAAAVGSKDVRHALFFLGTALAWSIAMRLESSILIADPLLLRSLVAITLAVVAYALGKQWKAMASPVVSPARQIS